MKKLIFVCALALGIAPLATVKAATVTVTAGFNSATAITVQNSAVNPFLTFTVAVGSWDGATWTQFGTAISDTGSVNGSFTATGPAELNSDVIFVYVGFGSVNPIAGFGQWALLQVATNTTFPADVSNTLGSATVAFHNTTPGNVIYVTGNNLYLLGNVLQVPEPSSVLITLLAAVGLLRRRR